jgi:hypothetical protein
MAPKYACPPLIIQGKRFLRDGKPFIFRGIVYQIRSRDRSRGSSGPRDPLIDEQLPELSRHVDVFKDLGINALWVYTFDPSRSHDACMKLLKDNGIYVFIGCMSTTVLINRMSPLASYGGPLLERCYAIVDVASSYDHVAGIVVSQSVVNAADNTKTAEVVKALVRDVKNYTMFRSQQAGQRRLPIGIGEEQWPSMRAPSLQYHLAGHEHERVDFYACVNFSKAELLPWEQQDWHTLTKRMRPSSVPVILSEFGNNTVRPRTFDEVRTLYSPEMRAVFSGGFVYEFEEAANRYGIVKSSEDNAERLEEFFSLKQRFAEAKAVLESADDLSQGTSETRMEVAPYPPVTDLWHASSNIPQDCPLSPEEYVRQ